MNKQLLAAWGDAVTKGMLCNATERARAVRRTDSFELHLCHTCAVWCWEIIYLFKPQLFVCNMENVTNVFDMKLHVQRAWALEKDAPSSSSLHTPIPFPGEKSK